MHGADDGGVGEGRARRLMDRGPLAALVLFGVLAVAGYALFGRSPARLGGLSAGAARFYAVSFSFFAQAQVLLAAVVLAVHLARRTGWRWLWAFVPVYGLSLGSELLGTAYGVPFGPYAYTDLLGPKWLGLVPVLIPLSWWFMAVPAYALGTRALGGVESGSEARVGPGSEGRGEGRAARAKRVLLGSLLLLAWDLSLDPAMSEVVRYWVWGERGPYYGMPLVNLAGWYVTGVVLMGILEATRSWAWVRRISTWWWAAFYAANLVLPLGLTVAAGLWGAAVATALVLGGVAWASSRSRGGAESWSAGAEVVG